MPFIPNRGEVPWDELAGALPEGALSTDPEVCRRYCSDETEDLCFVPEAVAFPSSTEDVQHIARFCYAHDVPMTPRGAGTGLSGGALPVRGGLVVSFERMNRIVEIDPANMWAVVEPGVITEVLQEAAARQGLFYPPDPASKGSCFIGGNIAENSGGPRALKYGVTKDYVLNLEIVLPTGETFWTGAPTTKNATGYNLTQLIVGSEGTLAFVTRAVLRLIPHPKVDYLLLAAFDSPEAAGEAAWKVQMAGVAPSALELMERTALQLGADYLGRSLPVDDGEAFLLIEVDGMATDETWRRVEKAYEVLAPTAKEVLMAESDREKEQLWGLRRAIAHGVRARSVYKEEDTVVPLKQVPYLLRYVHQLEAKYGFRCVCYGHVGDGNVHVNILREGLSERQWKELLPRAVEELFREVVRLGGTISGEHGIGYVQRRYMPIAFSRPALDLMHRLKAAFDPKGLLNPGKVIP